MAPGQQAKDHGSAGVFDGDTHIWLCFDIKICTLKYFLWTLYNIA